jgi:hypothetical protein
LPPLRVAINVCASVPLVPEPEYSFTVTVPRSPLAVPAAPENVGVALLVVLLLAGFVNVTTGATVSTVNVLAVLEPVVFEPELDCCACAV